MTLSSPTVLTQLANVLVNSGWKFHRQGEWISPDRRWIVKTGYANFTQYVQIQSPNEGHRAATIIEHKRLDNNTELLTVLSWLHTYGIRVEAG